MLARNDGVLTAVRSTEPIEFKLNAFVAKIGRQPIENLHLAASPSPDFDLIYPLEGSTFPGSGRSWVGQYKSPVRASFEASGAREGRRVIMRASASLPAQELQHPDLPRHWAKARVDALLEKRSSAMARTRRPSMRSFACPASTNSSRLIHRFWLRRELCSARG